MKRAQIEAWLTLEGCVPYVHNHMWSVHEGGNDWNRWRNVESDTWERLAHETDVADKLIEWAEIPLAALQQLYNTLVNYKENGHDT